MKGFTVQTNKYRGCDKNTKVINRLFYHFEKLFYIISFVCLKLEQMWPLVTCLQGKLAEVYFRFKKIEDIIHIYEDHMKRLTNWFQSVYAEAVTFTNKLGNEEK